MYPVQAIPLSRLWATTPGNGKTVAEAVDIANRAGGIVVGKLGTATVTSEELFG